MDEVDVGWAMAVASNAFMPAGTAAGPGTRFSLDAGIESEPDLLEGGRDPRPDGVQLCGHARRQADVVAIMNPARDHGQEHAVVAVDVSEASTDAGRARQRVPLVEAHRFVAVVVESELETSLEDGERLVRLVVRV